MDCESSPFHVSRRHPTRNQLKGTPRNAPQPGNHRRLEDLPVSDVIPLVLCPPYHYSKLHRLGNQHSPIRVTLCEDFKARPANAAVEHRNRIPRCRLFKVSHFVLP